MWTNYSLCVSTQEKRLKVAPQEPPSPPGEQQKLPLCLIHETLPYVSPSEAEAARG